MYLKSLTVLGFKSFADKTSLNFLPGVTAIVGPNGCGKSNVSDAIRWVLGEQSAKALRGGEMADVIFSGTDGRKPLGMAEVSLMIGDVGAEHLTVAGVEIDYNEVTVTRRVFRDGASEYFINKTPCRLKDIQQLFMGTGVGRTSYSIMAQGNITQILSSRPEDRRMIFEEAAGITKFKSQKREALRKLEHTDQNLVRVEDLIREVKRQIGSLQRQAGKARRYKQLSQELQHLDTQLARHQFDVLQAELGERRAAADQCRAEIERGSQSVLRLEEELRQLRDLLSQLDHQISESQHRGMELKSQADRDEHSIQVNQERLRELETQNARALADIAQAEERRLIAEQERQAVSERLAASQAALEDKRRALEEKRQTLDRVEAGLRENQQALRDAQAESFQAAQQSARVRNEINALDLQKQGNVVRLEKLSSEKIQLEEERTRLEARVREFASSVEQEKLSVQTKRGTLEERQQRLREIQQQLGLTSQELDGLVRQQAEHKSRLNVLEQLDTSHEGFGAGALAALSQSQWVLGSLADKMRVPDQYVAAVEAALGHHLQLVLTEQPASAQHILADLSAQKKGRASIASLALGAEPARHPAPPLPEHSLPALGVIEADPLVRPLLQSLLDRTLIVPDLAEAAGAWTQAQGGWDFVTHTGELLDRHGIFTGGNGNGSGKAASILGRKNQILELQSQLGHLGQQIAEISRQKGALQSEHTSLLAGLQQVQTELRAQEVAIATHEGECNALQASVRTLHQKIDTVVFEIQTLSAQDQEGACKRQELAAQLAQGQESEERATGRVAEQTAAQDALRQQRDEAQAALTECKVAAASEEQLCASFAQQQAPLESRIAELTELAQARRDEIAGCLKRRGQFESEIAAASARIERLQHEREQVGRRTAELQGRRDEQDQGIQGREEDLRARREQLAALQQRRGDLEVELAQKTMAGDNLRDRVRQKYQVNLDDIRSECITIIMAEEGPARIKTLTPEEMAAAGVATDWTAVAEQVEALQKRLDDMGPVNLVAIDEYEETEQRHQFLTTQHEDLIKAKQQLMEVINRINSQTKEMFLETFHRIRDNFVSMFAEVFGGGKADLRLVDEGDVLESGIEIMARPPGKQLQTISLLSGGEQTMTAVALLFSIYQVKPSPFCVLDELDAPLDESNINRFIRILKRFIEHSQFIVITHNKRTIGMADVLYGVTMQEHGVSRIVSVKFHKAETEAAGRPAASLETPVPDHAMEDEEDKVQPKEETLEVAMAK